MSSGILPLGGRRGRPAEPRRQDAEEEGEDSFGIEMLAPYELDLTPGCVERARAERGEAPLAD